MSDVKLGFKSTFFLSDLFRIIAKLGLVYFDYTSADPISFCHIKLVSKIVTTYVLEVLFLPEVEPE